MIRTKCVGSPIDRKKDGLRILVTRLWPRGLRKSRCDAWMPNLGPSQAILDAIKDDKLTWAAFSRAYRRELFEGGSIDRRNPLIKNHGQKFTLRLLQTLQRKGPVTLLCYCSEDQDQCHRHVLKKLLDGKV